MREREMIFKVIKLSFIVYQVCLCLPSHCSCVFHLQFHLRSANRMHSQSKIYTTKSHSLIITHATYNECELHVVQCNTQTKYMYMQIV